MDLLKTMTNGGVFNTTIVKIFDKIVSRPALRNLMNIKKVDIPNNSLYTETGPNGLALYSKERDRG